MEYLKSSCIFPGNINRGNNKEVFKPNCMLLEPSVLLPNCFSKPKLPVAEKLSPPLKIFLLRKVISKLGPVKLFDLVTPCNSARNDLLVVGDKEMTAFK